MDDVPFCGTPWYWRWPHRLGFILAVVAFVLSLTAVMGVKIGDPNLNLQGLSVVALSLGVALLSASSLTYRKTVGR